MLEVLLAALLGAGAGVATGLLPGMHVNNLALLLLAWPAPGAAPLPLAAFLAAVAVAHTFVNIVPATFYGSPDEASGIVLLPAHSLLREGRGGEAVDLSALASGVALLAALLLAFPFAWLLGEPLRGYALLRAWLPALLLGLALFLLLDDARSARGPAARLARLRDALLVFLLAGGLGLAALGLPVRSPLGLPASVLLPLFAGLFAVPTLLAAWDAAPVPRAASPRSPLPRGEARPLVLSCAAGSAAGALTSFLPGITGGASTVLALALRGRTGARHAIATLSAVNTAGVVFTLAVLFAVGRERSGVATATARLLPAAQGIAAPEALLLFAAMGLAGVVAYPATVLLGHGFARLAALPPRAVAASVLGLLAAAVLAWTGARGALVLLAAALVGWLPVARRVRRVHLMGCLLVPMLGRLWLT